MSHLHQKNFNNQLFLSAIPLAKRAKKLVLVKHQDFMLALPPI
jgi:hypothetical protein